MLQPFPQSFKSCFYVRTPTCTRSAVSNVCRYERIVMVICTSTILVHRKLQNTFLRDEEPAPEPPRKQPIQLPTSDPEFDRPSLATAPRSPPVYEAAPCLSVLYSVSCWPESAAEAEASTRRMNPAVELLRRSQPEPEPEPEEEEEPVYEQVREMPPAQPVQPPRQPAQPPRLPTQPPRQVAPAPVSPTSPVQCRCAVCHISKCCGAPKLNSPTQFHWSCAKRNCTCVCF